MHEAAFVQRLQRAQETERNLCRVSRGQRPAKEPLAQCLAGQAFHHDERAAGLLAELVNLTDVRVVERGCGPCFPPEPLDTDGAANHLAHQFQCDSATDAIVEGLVHDSHSSFSEPAEDAIAANGLRVCHDSAHIIQARRKPFDGRQPVPGGTAVRPGASGG